MPNFRTTAGMAIAAAVCGLLLWTLEHWRPEGGASASDTPGLLFPSGLGEVDSLIVEQGAFRGRAAASYAARFEIGHASAVLLNVLHQVGRRQVRP